MRFCCYNEINLYDLSLDLPQYNQTNQIFISKVLNNGNIKPLNIKSDSLRLVSFKDNILQTEFLYSSNNFYKFINDMDTQFKNEIIYNGTKWFGENINNNTLNNIFKYSVSLPDKLPGLPMLNFILDDSCKILNKKKQTNIDDLKQNMEIELQFTIEEIHYQKYKCYPVFKIKQIKIVNDICQTLESLLDSSSKEEDKIESHDNNNSNSNNSNSNNNKSDKSNNNSNNSSASFINNSIYDIDSETHDITASTFMNLQTK